MNRSYLIVAIVGWSIVALTAGCPEIKPPKIEMPPDVAGEVKAEIDDAIGAIESESESWRTVLEKLLHDLPQEVNNTIRTEIQNLLDRSIANVGTEFRCDVDFMARRIVQTLTHIRDEITGHDSPPLPPVICHVVPTNIDLNLEAHRRAIINIYGYDLDHKDSAKKKFKAAVLGENGLLYEIPESLIGRTTHHYEAAINVADEKLLNILYRKQAKKIQFYWDGAPLADDKEVLGEVIITPWTPKRRTLTEQTLEDSPKVLCNKKAGSGDKDYQTGWGHDTRVTVTVETKKREGQIQARVEVRGRELVSDYTTLTGDSKWFGRWSPPPGEKIISFSPVGTSEGKVLFKAGTASPQRNVKGTGDVADEFDIWGDQVGDDINYTAGQVDFAKVSVELETLPPAEFNPTRDLVSIGRFRPRTLTPIHPFDPTIRPRIR